MRISTLQLILDMKCVTLLASSTGFDMDDFSENVPDEFTQTWAVMGIFRSFIIALYNIVEQLHHPLFGQRFVCAMQVAANVAS